MIGPRRFSFLEAKYFHHLLTTDVIKREEEEENEEEEVMKIWCVSLKQMVVEQLVDYGRRIDSEASLK